jgi:hypothetical protein
MIDPIGVDPPISDDPDAGRAAWLGFRQVGFARPGTAAPGVTTAGSVD